MEQTTELNGIVRREKIYDIIKETTTVNVKELSTHFAVSDMTIRRDLHIMEEQGILTVHYGGATLRRRSLDFHSFDMRKEDFYEEKISIAKRAAELIKENDVIYLDPSTTVLLMTHFLPPLHITVVTSSLSVMEECAHNHYVNLFIAPGKYHAEYGGAMNTETMMYLSGFHFTSAFLGTGFIDTVYGVTSTEIDCSIKQAVMRNSEKTILLVDHSKFGHRVMKKFGDISDFFTIITDSGIDQKDERAILQQNVKLQICDMFSI